VNVSFFRIISLAFALLVTTRALGQQGEQAKPTVPKVEMSQAHEETCLVKVGDQFPIAQLTDLQGNNADLKGLFGKKLTVIVIWNNDQAYSREAYRALGPQILKQFKGKPIVGIAINHGNTADVVKAAAEKFGKDISTLLDTDDALWKKVAKSKVPRIYLLDAKGKILWMDIEFSRGSRRDLDSAIKASL
jgi:hypothetical protein